MKEKKEKETEMKRKRRKTSSKRESNYIETLYLLATTACLFVLINQQYDIDHQKHPLRLMKRNHLLVRKFLLLINDVLVE